MSGYSQDTLNIQRPHSPLEALQERRLGCWLINSLALSQSLYPAPLRLYAKEKGLVYSWGVGAHGRLGHGNETTLWAPKPGPWRADLAFRDHGWWFTLLACGLSIQVFGQHPWTVEAPSLQLQRGVDLTGLSGKRRKVLKTCN